MAPAITALNDNGFVVSWHSLSQDGSGWGIYAQRYAADGTAQGGEFLVNTNVASDQMSPAITTLTGGSFVVSWMSYNQDGGGWGVYAQRFDANGVAQRSEFRVNTTKTDTQLAPAITALSDGGFVVSWQSLNQDGSSYGIYAQRYNASGIAQGSEFRVNTTVTDTQLAPAITALNGGGFVVSWQSFNQDGSGHGCLCAALCAGWHSAGRGIPRQYDRGG
jgi:hypothetical protein